MTKILYLEDEKFLGRIVKESLISRGYEINHIEDGAHVISAFNDFNPDLCILDVMVPHIDGFALGQKIKSIQPNMPIIYLTAKSQTEDIIQGFSSGGNDYIKKPFSMEELIVRINNLLQLTDHQDKGEKVAQRQLGEYIFKYEKFELHHLCDIFKLSHRENELILLLSNHINKQLDRRLILNTLWGDDSLYNSRNLDVYIRKLRILFKRDENIKITTLRGVGYFFGING